MTVLKKKIVVMGGGGGTFFTLQSLKHDPSFEITAIISTSDSGGSSGILRGRHQVIPPSDIMRAVTALSRYDSQTLQKIFYKNRFTRGELKGHNLGNLALVSLMKLAGMEEGIEALSDALECRGKVYPTTFDPHHLHARLVDNSVLEGEHVIDVPPENSARIAEVYHVPATKMLEKSRQAILGADYVLMGPGSLYTSIIASLLCEDTIDVFAISKAKTIFIASDGYAARGERGATTLSESIAAIEKHLHRQLDLILYNKHIISDSERQENVRKGRLLLEPDISNIVYASSRVIFEDFKDNEGEYSVEAMARMFKKILV